MRCSPNMDSDITREEVEELKAEPWMLALLDLNPSYPHWGPHEDYMWKEKEGWDSRQIFPTWKDFGPWNLDELNECVNFYFQVTRKSVECDVCERSGYNQATKQIADDFYGHDYHAFPVPGSSPLPAVLGGGYMTVNREVAWKDKITQDEVDALIAEKRLHQFNVWQWQDGQHVRTLNPDGTPYTPTAEEVNNAERTRFVHDAINRMILIETRAKRFGVYGHCSTCNGKGELYVEEKGKVGLVLWWLHPRKGCSRGLEIERLEKAELPVVFAFLREAAKRNAERFKGVASATESPKVLHVEQENHFLRVALKEIERKAAGAGLKSVTLDIIRECAAKALRPYETADAQAEKAP